MRQDKTENKTVRKVAWIVLIALIIILLGLVLYNAYAVSTFKSDANKYPIVDTRIYQLESLKANTVGNIALLFNITDNNSYRQALQRNNLSAELQSRLFPDNKYQVSTSPVTVKAILYKITDEDYYEFLIYMESKEKSYTLQAVYSSNKLVDLISLD